MDKIEETIAMEGVAHVLTVWKPNEREQHVIAMSAFRKSIEAIVRHQLAALHGASAAATRILLGNAPAVAEIPPVRDYVNLGVTLGFVDRTGLDTLRSSSAVSKVYPAPSISLIRPVHSAKSAALTGATTWGVRKIGAPAAWNRGITGKGVLVGHLDTGIDSRHPALRRAVHAFAEFNWVGDAVPGASARDPDGHGTHTAATIAGRSVDGYSVGVAPDAMIASALVIEGGDVISRVLGGLDWIVGEGARVLSMSLGLRGWDASFEAIIDVLIARGVLPVIAVGNEGPGTSRSPGNYRNVLSVGAVDREGRVAGFSGSQTRTSPEGSWSVPVVVAPGVSVISAEAGAREFVSLDGSSMATPHVAGMAALLLEAFPSATPQQLHDAIVRSCRPVLDPFPRGGSGTPNVGRALSILKSL